MTRPHEAHRALRAATADAHARLDALVGEWRHTDDYRDYLRGMERFLAECDAALGADAARGVQRRDLAADLATLGAAPLPDVAADASPADGAVARLGWEYVLAGASLGARVLLKRAHVLGLDAGHGAAFLAAHAGSAEWPQVLARLADDRDGEDLVRLCAAASAAFAAAESAFRAALDSAPDPEEAR